MLKFLAPQKRKYSKLFWIISIFIVLLLAGFAFLGIFMDKKFNDAVAGIQNNLADVAAAKANGDSIMAGRKIKTTMDSVQTEAITAARNLAELSVPDELKNYQAVAISWAIKVAVAQPAGWKNLQNQPDDFPLAITDARVYNIFKSMVKTIADLKKPGVVAIKNKDREAMLKIGVKTLVQNHWLKALLYSQVEYEVSVLADPVLASLDVPQVGQGLDVTCSVCDFPDAYKVHWTAELRRQYGCDTRCHPKIKSTEEQTVTDDTATKDAEKYADSLAAYDYNNTPKRVVCIGTGGTENRTGGEAGSHKFCVEDAVSLTNEIAASAIDFANSTKSLSVDKWNSEYRAIDLALGTASEMPSQPATTGGKTKIPPSQPSTNKLPASGGHKEGGQGTIQQGEPIASPELTPQNKGGIWDGTYKLGPASCSCRNLSDFSHDCATYKRNENTIPSNSYVTVMDNMVFSFSLAPVDANGYAKKNFSGTPESYTEYVDAQFVRLGSGASVTVRFVDYMPSWHDVICTYIGTRQ